MSTQLLYNSQQILSGQATPFVGRQDSFIRYGDRWADKTTFSLHGQITGCTYQDLLNNQTVLIDIFKKDFQKFQIIEGSGIIFDAPYTIVRGISFPQSQYNYILNYIVSLDCYKQDLFSGYYGVLEPTDEWAYSEEQDYKVGLTHTVGARGFNADADVANALENARDFVYQRTGLNNGIAPAFISGKSGSLNFCLKDLKERIDRFNGNYSIVETYVADAYYGTNGMLRYTTSFDCNTVEGLSRVTIQGEIDACGHSSSMDSIRTRYSGLSLYNIAYDTFTGAGVTGTLNSGYVSNGIVEDPFNKKVSFQAVYDNNPDPLVYLDYGVNLEVSENEITTATFQGTVKGRGDINARWPQVLAYYSGVNPYVYALNAYNDFSPSSPYTLNSLANNESTAFNQFNAEINISKTFDNKDLPPIGFKNFTYSLHFVPSFERVAFIPLANVCGLNPQYYVVDLGYKTRCQFSIQGDGKICAPDTIANGVSYVRQFGNSQFGQYCPILKAVLERKEIGTTDQDVNFNFAWSADSLFGINKSGSYALIEGLKLK
jgi:hypothetical protein